MARDSHLTEEQLAQFQDGEASPADAAHLESCPDCAARARALNEMVAVCSEYRSSTQPPKPWLSLETLIANHELSHGRQQWRRWPAFVFGAATCIALAVVVLRSPGTGDSGRMAELLTRSSRASQPAGRLLSLRLQGRTVIRPAVLSGDDVRDPDPAVSHLHAVFVEAHYSWEEPLSARSFLAWRNGLRRKRDSVSVIRRQGGEQSYRLRTETPAGVLRSVALTLRGEDLRPTGGNFDFAGEGAIDLQELADAPAASASPRVQTPDAREPAISETPAGPDDVLHVLAALDAIGADVGEPVDVSEDNQHQHVVVHAAGLAPARRRAVATALADLPKVVLDFESRSQVAAPTLAPAPEKSANNIPPEFRRQLEERFGGAAALQEATDAVLDTSASALARAHAIKVLAENFPPEIVARMKEPDQNVLRTLHQRHASELIRLVAQIRRELRPVLATGIEVPPSTSDAWQSQAADLVASAHQTDDLLNRLFAGSYTQAAGEEMMRQLATAVARFDAAAR